ncbi:biliverdin-producing heme oxygenase [Vibrio cholerae]|nr:biliverdin-producing heme oxygenase [Vibrio cholerae]KAA1202060.1 iron-containing redox enzyme family protein [Vibrio cholerae]KAA1210245.1 iron-containing redox enzyme family protein [Vibrio cholerae]KAA1224695.1 iron-containing redox enzyme family protein [Vibrio cholerae]MCD1218025.1 biliverdin-producing heme oxygenase [Vibrio cholerae]
MRLTMRRTLMTGFFQRLQKETQSAQQQMLQAPVFAACARGEITLDMYLSFLTQAYHHVKHTVPLLMACGGRLSDRYEWVRIAIADYIDEEKGHQEWILNDIRVCGGDAQAVRNNQGGGQVSTPIELMVAYLYHQIDRANPLALFGMVWVLEGTSVGVGGNIARLVKQQLNLPAKAMSYLTSHSELDQDHIRFFESLMDKITAEEDQQAIIHSANQVFYLYGQMLRELLPQTQQQAA